MKVLILGGTTEASAIALELDRRGMSVVLSLAGRTRAPVLPAVPGRRGGFGGVPGLAAYLQSERIGALVDATHPFAAQMHANAAAAAHVAGVPRVAVSRPPWQAAPGDRWTEVVGMPAAVTALGPTPRRVFLTIGQQELAPFRAAPWHIYLIRSIEPPDPAATPPNATFLAARGPFTLPDELALLQEQAIEVLVTKNAGGPAVAAKLEAARTLGLPVIMVSRPPPPEPPLVPDAAGAVAFVTTLMRQLTS